MKLVLCIDCQDIFSLRQQARVCMCGRSGGRYLNSLDAVYWGPRAVPLGINNRSLVQVLKDQDSGGDLIVPQGQMVPGRTVDAFLIPSCAPTMRKIKVTSPAET